MRWLAASGVNNMQHRLTLLFFSACSRHFEVEILEAVLTLVGAKTLHLMHLIAKNLHVMRNFVNWCALYDRPLKVTCTAISSTSVITLIVLEHFTIN